MSVIKKLRRSVRFEVFKENGSGSSGSGDNMCTCTDKRVSEVE